MEVLGQHPPLSRPLHLLVIILPVSVEKEAEWFGHITEV